MMTTRWHDDERLPADLRERAQAAAEGLKARVAQHETDPESIKAQYKRQNDAARARYLAELDTKKQAERDRHAAAEAERLAPVKRRECLQWLYDHPGMTEADFEKVWPARREVLQLGDRDAMIEREVSALRERRGY